MVSLCLEFFIVPLEHNLTSRGLYWVFPPQKMNCLFSHKVQGLLLIRDYAPLHEKVLCLNVRISGSSSLTCLSLKASYQDHIFIFVARATLTFEFSYCLCPRDQFSISHFFLFFVKSRVY